MLHPRRHLGPRTHRNSFCWVFLYAPHTDGTTCGSAYLAVPFLMVHQRLSILKWHIRGSTSLNRMYTGPGEGPSAATAASAGCRSARHHGECDLTTGNLKWTAQSSRVSKDRSRSALKAGLFSSTEPCQHKQIRLTWIPCGVGRELRAALLADVLEGPGGVHSVVSKAQGGHAVPRLEGHPDTGASFLQQPAHHQVFAQRRTSSSASLMLQQAHGAVTLQLGLQLSSGNGVFA